MKINFAIVAFEVEKMYNKDIKNDSDIEQQCLLIAEYIKSCGYTEEEYIQRYYNNNTN